MGDFTDPFMRNKDAAVQARTKAQNRANVLQLKLIGQSHPTGLTNNLLKLFEPRPPLEHKPPPEKRKCPPYTGMAQFVSHFAEPGQPEYAPPVQKGETPALRRARVHSLRLEEGAIKAAEELLKYDPSKDPNISGDPYKTLFVARLNYETTEHRIKREFEAYGPIKRVRLITDKETNKPRGYGFIEYMHTRDMKTAYKQADGRKLDNRRVLVDVERGRTVPNWRPRRLGGGLGSTRVGGEEVNQRYSGREPQQIASGGRLRSEEPKARDDRLDRDGEKSRERGRDREREREKSHERSQDRVRDRDPREERHHKDRDRNRDRDKERDRGRDRVRVRDRDRDRERGREYDRDRDRPRERTRERERGYDRATSHEKDRGRAHEKDTDFDHIDSKHDRELPGARDKDYDIDEPDQGRELYDEPVKHGRGRDYDHYEQPKYQEQYDQLKPRGRGEPEPEPDRDRSKRHDEPKYNDDEPYDDSMEPGDYRSQYERADSVPRERERTGDRDYEYHRSERSLSPEYDC